jgi:hypothetical protein
MRQPRDHTPAPTPGYRTWATGGQPHQQLLTVRELRKLLQPDKLGKLSDTEVHVRLDTGDTVSLTSGLVSETAPNGQARVVLTPARPLLEDEFAGGRSD